MLLLCVHVPRTTNVGSSSRYRSSRHNNDGTSKTFVRKRCKEEKLTDVPDSGLRMRTRYATYAVVEECEDRLPELPLLYHPSVNCRCCCRILVLWLLFASSVYWIDVVAAVLVVVVVVGGLTGNVFADTNTSRPRTESHHHHRENYGRYGTQK